jgi:hypothetical protein
MPRKVKDPHRKLRDIKASKRKARKSGDKASFGESHPQKLNIITLDKT